MRRKEKRIEPNLKLLKISACIRELFVVPHVCCGGTIFSTSFGKTLKNS